MLRLFQGEMECRFCQFSAAGQIGNTLQSSVPPTRRGGMHETRGIV